VSSFFFPIIKCFILSPKNIKDQPKMHLLEWHNFLFQSLISFENKLFRSYTISPIKKTVKLKPKFKIFMAYLCEVNRPFPFISRN
jgi:hypothetical protein